MKIGNLRFANDDDLLQFEPNLEQVWPRLDEGGSLQNNWDVQHRIAMRDIQSFFDSRKNTAERFELGRMGLRDQENMREPAAWLALHYIYVAADTQGDADGWFARKASHYWGRAMDRLEALAQSIDYDIDESGAIDDIEKNQPHPARVIRG